MNEIMEKENIIIKNLIYEVRGKQVMLDSDLAKLYECKNGTKDINKAVKRNIERFPEDFYFQLTKSEMENLKFQNGTSSYNSHGGVRKMPFVFTEQGVAMLSSVLKTEVASRVSVSIMRAFVAMRKYLSNNLLEQKYVHNMVFKLDERVSLLENTFSKFDTFSNELFFDGQIWDSHSLLLDIFNSSSKSIVIIDNYISKELLDVVCKTNKDIVIYTKNIDKIMINKYQSQYSNLTIKINNSFHDRFIIIDDNILYHCGASFKDLGKKCFAINRIDDKELLSNLKKIL